LNFEKLNWNIHPIKEGRMIVMSLLRGCRPALGLSNTLKQDTSVTKQLIRDLRTGGTKGSAMNKDHHLKSLRATPSRYQWQIFKDQLHFYIFLGVIPLSAVVFYANVFIGPATLCEIPEGYVPKQWEYFQHPIKRFFARYLITLYQEQYERNIHYTSVMEEKRRMRLMTQKVEHLMQERGDYPNYYTNKTFLSKYVRGMQKSRDDIDDVAGEF